MVGREVQKAFGQDPQVILTVPLIEGTDGKLKMSKSYDNYIGITEPPNQIYGKVMSIPDELVVKYYKLVLYYDEVELKKVEKEMQERPRDTKAKLAYEIVKLFWSQEDARRAEEEFNRVFREKGIPDEIPEYRIPEEGIWIVELLADSGLVSSRSEARRLIKQRAVKLDDVVIEDESKIIKLESKETILRVGKRKFLKLVKSG